MIIDGSASDREKKKRALTGAAWALAIIPALLPFAGFAGIGMWYFALPLLLAAFVLAIVCMAQGVAGEGVAILSAVLLVPLWLHEFPRVAAFIREKRVEIAERERAEAEAAQKRAEQTPRVFVPRQAPPTRIPTARPTPTAEEAAAAQLAASQTVAVRKRPELGVAGSPLNREFLAEYERLKRAGDPLLGDPRHPEVIADRVAEAIARKAARR